MDFQLNEEQRLVAESLNKLFGDTGSKAKRRQLREGAESFDRAAWQALAEQGVLSLTLPEAVGGFGGSGIDLLVVAEQMGTHLVYEPFLSTVVLGASAISLAGSAEQQAKYLPAVASGELLLAAALGEPQGRFDVMNIRSEVRQDGPGAVLTGEKSVVIGGDHADTLIVSARSADGLGLYLVERTAPGVEVRPYRLVDGRGAADVTFQDAPVIEQLAGGESAEQVIGKICDLAASSLCAEALGALTCVNAMTRDYLQNRQQFGRPIGSFQVLQHKLADMQIFLEHLKSLVFEAAMQADAADDRLREQAVSAAKMHVADNGRKIGELAMQMHGGIGVTDELELGEYVKRAHVAGVLFGDEDHHVARYGRWMAEGDA